jgi:Fic family protein
LAILFTSQKSSIPDKDIKSRFFTDGNGRVGRELFNLYLLMRSKPPYMKLLFLGKDRPEYLQALRHGDEERYAEIKRVDETVGLCRV